MTRDAVLPPRERFWAGTNPWPALGAGLGLTAVALLLQKVAPDSLVVVRVGLVLGGLLAAGFAVAVRFRAMGWGWDERLTTAGVTALAALAAVLANYSLNDDWDSATLLMGVLTAVGLAGAGVLLLPRGGRRLVISLLVLFHFGGILTAVTTAPPPNGQAPWLTRMMWSYVYRPYLDFMYLNNAYHFYSPDPGPPSLLWFYVEYEDGSIRELKIPNKGDFPTRLAYQRRLALTESCAPTQMVPPNRFEELLHRRLAAAVASNPQIPLHPEMPASMQYAEPNNEYSKPHLASYARHVARTYKHETNPELPVKQVKVYRLIHRILTASELAYGIDPLDPTNYAAFYQGAFDGDGTLLNSEDPFLYWLMPIFRVQKDPGPFRSPFNRKDKYKADDWVIHNYLEVHAGVK